MNTVLSGYSDNEKTVKQEDDIKAIMKCSFDGVTK